MVGVLFVFLLMLTIFALNYRDDSAQLDVLIQRQRAAEARAAAAEQRAVQEKAAAEEQSRAATLARADAEEQSRIAALARAEAQEQSRIAALARSDAEEQSRIAALARIEAENQAVAAHQKAEEAARLRAQNEALRLRLADAATALQHELQDREAARAGLLQRLADRLEKASIKFTIDQRSGVLRLSDAIPFATGHSDLTDPRARQTLQVLGEVLADVLPCFTTGVIAKGCEAADTPILETVLVEGHTDSQPYPNMTQVQSQQENDWLSAERALTVFTEVRRQQPLLEALRGPADQPLLGISGYGQRRPLPDALTTAEADLTRNRRIDIRFVLSSRTSDEVRHLLDEIVALQANGQ
jgi:flagellar motor protein MotB